MGSTGCCGGWARFKPIMVLAYRNNKIAMMLPPGNDSTSGSKLPPMVCILAAMRPALDSMKLRFIMSVSYAAHSGYPWVRHSPQKLPEQHMPGQQCGLKKYSATGERPFLSHRRAGIRFTAVGEHPFQRLLHFANLGPGHT